MSKNYGLSIDDLEYARRKIARQKDWLENNHFTTANGEEKTLLDISYGANVSERYYSRLLNKIDTFNTISISHNLVPIFLTCTLDGFFRDFKEGDFSRFDEETRARYIEHIPNNNRNGYYMDMIDKEITLNNKDLYKILGHQLHRFNRSGTLQNIRKNGNDYTYVRVTEPHRDGTPHFHILMYAPIEEVFNIKKEFEKFFPAPQNHKIKKGGGYILDSSIRETNGFQTNIRSASSYILKYILKSFVNVKNQDEIDYLQAWYSHNRIPRMIMTHTLVSQDVYQTASIVDNDWFYLTETKMNGTYFRDVDNNSFLLEDTNGRRISYTNGVLTLSKGSKILNTYGEYKYIIPIVRVSKNIKFTVCKPEDFNIKDRYEIYIPRGTYIYNIVKNYKDGSQIVVSSGLLSIYNLSQYEPQFMDDVNLDLLIDIYEQGFNNFDIDTKVLSDYQIFAKSSISDYSLASKYYNFDYDKSTPQNYAYLHNEMIRRGLISGDKIDLNKLIEQIETDYKEFGF